MKFKKSILFNSCLIALIGILTWLPIFAQTDTIDVSVTAKNSAVSVADGIVAYGSANWSAATSTNPSGVITGQSQTATNDGSLGTLNIRSSQATNDTGWTMAAAIGTLDEFEHYFSTSTGAAVWYQFDTNPATYKTASTTVAAAGTMRTDLKIVIPASTSDFVAKSITVTLQAVAND